MHPAPLWLPLPWTFVYLVGMEVTKTLGEKANGLFGTHSTVRFLISKTLFSILSFLVFPCLPH